MTAPDRSTATNSSPYADAAMLVLPQVVLWPVAWFWVVLHRMSGAGCPDPGARIVCDYDLEYAANVGLWIGLPAISVLTFVALVVCQKRGRRRWPVAIAGFGLMVLAIYAAIQVISSALLVT